MTGINRKARAGAKGVLAPGISLARESFGAGRYGWRIVASYAGERERWTLSPRLSLAEAIAAAVEWRTERGTATPDEMAVTAGEQLRRIPGMSEKAIAGAVQRIRTTGARSSIRAETVDAAWAALSPALLDELRDAGVDVQRSRASPRSKANRA